METAHHDIVLVIESSATPNENVIRVSVEWGVRPKLFVCWDHVQMSAEHVRFQLRILSVYMNEDAVVCDDPMRDPFRRFFEDFRIPWREKHLSSRER